MRSHCTGKQQLHTSEEGINAERLVLVATRHRAQGGLARPRTLRRLTIVKGPGMGRHDFGLVNYYLAALANNNIRKLHRPRL